VSARRIVSVVVMLAAASPAFAQPLDPSFDPCTEGLRLFEARDYAGARPMLERCLHATPDNASALLALTVVTTTQGAFTLGVEHGARLVAATPDDPAARYWYGRALLGAGDLPAAEAQWEAGLELSQTHVGLLEGLARLAMDRGDDAKAYNLLTQIQLQGVTAGWVDRLLADIARRRGLWSKAADHWADSLAHDGETAEGLVILGEFSILAGDKTRAVEVFRRAVALESSGETWAGLGEAYFAADMPDSAEVALRRAIELAPDQPRQRFNLANILETTGRADEAGVQFQRYVEMAPDDAMGHLNYGIHLEKRGEFPAALAEATRALELDPSLTLALLTRARSLEQLGRRDEAIAAVDELARRNPAAQAELDLWRADLLEEPAANPEGMVLLAHIVTGDPAVSAKVLKGLAAGEDFADLAVKYSAGPTAAQGGTIGWIDPAAMAAPLQEAIEDLGVGEISPLVESGGLHHVFKRIR
jgi:tetratricopeptide (TPR) repeat protein